MARRTANLIFVAAALFWPSSLLAQDQPAKQEPPKQKPAAEPASPPDDPIKSLDELLGLEKSTPGERPDAADPTRNELDRKLSGEEAAEEFRQAVDLMGETALRITGSRDTGLVTQRLQEDIVRKLDMVIRAAQQQSQSSRSRSSSSQQDKDQADQQGRQRQQRTEQSRDGDNREAIEPPSRRDGALSPEVAARGAAWGSLPERVRDALLQGNEDTYSSLYKRLTEAYYKRLAEEGRR